MQQLQERMHSKSAVGRPQEQPEQQKVQENVLGKDIKAGKMKRSLGSKKEIMKGHAQAAIRKHEQLNFSLCK